MSDNVYPGMRFKETVGDRHCLWQEAVLTGLMVHHSLGQVTWPQPQRDSAHQGGATGGLGWAALTPKEKKLCNHQELLLWQVRLRTGNVSILWVRQVLLPLPMWVRNKCRLQSSYTGSSRLTGIGSESKAVTTKDFHLKSNANCWFSRGQVQRQAEQGAGCRRIFCVYLLLFFCVMILHCLF